MAKSSMTDSSSIVVINTTNSCSIQIKDTEILITDFTASWLSRMVNQGYTVFDADTETKFDKEASEILTKMSYYKDDYWQPLNEFVEIKKQ